ncbi:MAG: D-alanyl-D-alanine carboxypeptidase [Flavobacteriaceae bacterium]
MRTFYIIIFLWTPFIWGQRLNERRLTRQVEKIAVFQQAFVGLAVAPIEGGPLVGLEADHYMTPASNTKLLTFLGALQTFDSLPALDYAVENDSIFHFRPTGYPLLFHPFYQDSILDDFLLKQKLLNYHPWKKSPEPLGPGWSWDDYSYYYAAERSPFPIYGNAVQAVLEEGGLTMSPAFPSEATNTDLGLKRARLTNRFFYNPSQWKVGDTLFRPFKTSDTLFVRLLGQASKGDVLLDSTDRPDLVWKPFFTNQEERLYKGLLQDSDNGIAESLMLMIAKAQGKGFAAESAIDSLTSSWRPWLPDPIEWVDGSGVSRYNMITPKTLVAVLQQIYFTAGWEKIQAFFPQSGTSGTLKSYANLKGVYAKTGTLRHNHNLSGYWESEKGNRYAFSIMVNHFTSPTSEIREGITTLLQWLQQNLK